MADRNLIEELNSALQEQTKHFILKNLDEKATRQFIAELTAKELNAIIDSYDLKKMIEEGIKTQLRERWIPEAITQTLSEEEFKKTLLEAVMKAVGAGIKDGTDSLRRRLQEAITARY